jgi:hypothetical protein
MQHVAVRWLSVVWGRLQTTTILSATQRIVMSLVLIASSATACPVGSFSCVDEALLADLVAWAARLSGLPAAPIAQLPALRPVSAAELAREVCGEASPCRGVVAAYNTERREVLYVESFDMRDVESRSFIVHELVHYLQHQVRGERMASCMEAIASERQAYAAQNAYMQASGRRPRFGLALRLMSCPERTASDN